MPFLNVTCSSNKENKKVPLKTKCAHILGRAGLNICTANDAEDEIVQSNCRPVVNCRLGHACRLNIRHSHTTQHGLKAHLNIKTFFKFMWKFKTTWQRILQETHASTQPSALLSMTEVETKSNGYWTIQVPTSNQHKKYPLKKKKKKKKKEIILFRLLVFGSSWCNMADYKIRSSRPLWWVLDDCHWQYISFDLNILGDNQSA